MTDRVKGAIFDILGSRLGSPGLLPALRVLDLFAGAGSLGLESVSRGAGGCVFVERDARAVRVLRRNLGALDAGQSLRLVTADAWTCSVGGLVDDGELFGLVFVDPPYVESRDVEPAGKVPRLLRRLAGSGALAPEAEIVVHHERRVSLTAEPSDGWTVADRREYGTTAISFVVLASATSGQPPDAGLPSVDD